LSLFERDRKLLEDLDGVGIRPGLQVEVLSPHPVCENGELAGK
jgi:hypothetical protein